VVWWWCDSGYYVIAVVLCVSGCVVMFRDVSYSFTEQYSHFGNICGDFLPFSGIDFAIM